MYKKNLTILAAAVAVVAAMTGPSMAQETNEPTVRILLFSGREDPQFSLPAGSRGLEALRETLASAVSADFRGETVLPSILGYKGIVIQNPGGGGGLPELVAVYRGNIEVRDGETRFAVDDGRRLERTLLTLAVERDLVGAELLEAEKLGEPEPEDEPDESGDGAE